MNIYDKNENTYRALAKAFEPLELEGQLRYLPSFECCGSCASSRLHGFMSAPDEIEDWGSAEFYITFNEQTKDRADDSGELMLLISGFNNHSSKSDDYRLKIREVLLNSGFEEIEVPKVEYYSRAMHDPSFKPKTFYFQQTLLIVRGYFEGKARPTKKVRKSLKESTSKPNEC